jgi:hypothetical protein
MKKPMNKGIQRKKAIFTVQMPEQRLNNEKAYG